MSICSSVHMSLSLSETLDLRNRGDDYVFSLGMGQDDDDPLHLRLFLDRQRGQWAVYCPKSY